MSDENKFLTALEAIEARIEGVFDHPALMAVGALSPDSDIDVLRIARAAIAKAKEDE